MSEPTLSVEERREIEAELGRYADKRAASIDALKIVQRHRGWVSDEALAAVASMLELSVDELDGVATFYNLLFRRPVGRHVILLCDTVSCWIVGYERIRDHLMDRLAIPMGGTTVDGRFTLLPIACLGTCEGAPAMMIDGELYTDLDPERVDAILESYA